MRHIKAIVYPGPIDQAEGIIEHLISITGNVDAGGDVIMPGAFTKTLQEWGPAGKDRIRAVWQHEIDEPIGRPIEMREVSRAELPAEVLARTPEALGGLMVKTKFSKTDDGQKAFTLCAEGILNEWSIGYYPVKWDMAETDEGYIRRLSEVMLCEYSLVTLAMNEGAMNVAIKSSRHFHRPLPIAADNTDWQPAAALKRVKEWAGGDDDQLRAAFLLPADDPADNRHLIADIIAGQLKAIPAAIFAAVAVAEPTPALQKAAGVYYAHMKRLPPWERQPRPDAAGIIEGVLSKSRRGQSPALVAAELMLATGQPAGEDVATDTILTAVDLLTKAGRVLSARNVEKITATLAELDGAIASLRELLAAAEPPAPPALTEEKLDQRIKAAALKIKLNTI